MCTAKSRLLLLRPLTLTTFLLSAYIKGPQACRLSILALALTLFVGACNEGGDANLKATGTADTLSAGSLREAIISANATPGADVIDLPAGTYVLTIIGTDDDAAAGDLDITDDLTINGAGAAITIIDANGIDRVFHVIDANVTFFAVTISNGTAPDSGGGIANIDGTVALRNSIVSDNTATFAGGGIFNGIFNTSSATVTLINSTVSDNAAPDDGGGIRNELGTVELIDSTVSGNTTNDDGGGIRNDGGTVTLIKSTVSGNMAVDPGGFNTNFGGGILNNNGGIVTLTNSTVSGNMAADQGGGMRNEESSTVTLSNSTITANTTGARGGGIRNLGAVSFQNTIIAGNTAGSTGPDCSSSASVGGTLTSLGYNLVGAGTGCPSAALGDQTVNPADVFTLVLGPLQDNGGPTTTHALLAGSPAIDAGNPAGCTDDTGAPLTTDQRGVSRPLGLACDIGAYEEGP